MQIDEVFALKTVPITKQDTTRVTVISNRTSISEPILHVLESAKLKFRSKAYLHWYAKYGVEAE